MGEPSEGDRFRQEATAIYRGVRIALPVFVVAIAWLGWHFAGGWGLAIAGVAGLLFGCVGWFAATMLWALSQDGA